MRLNNFRNYFVLCLSFSVLLGASIPTFAAKKKESPGDSGVERELRFREGDESGNEVKALKTELLVIKSEKKALEQLLRLHKKYVNTRMEAEILFRLAEIYMRRARSERFFEVHRSSERIMTFAPQLVKEASESAEIRKSIDLYLRIQEKFPRFHSMDVVLFNNAYANQQIGEDQKAAVLFEKLIKNHVSSQLVPDSYLALGEIHFKSRRFEMALENFNAIHKYPRARVYPYGLYKAAWTYYNLQDAAHGIKKLEEVVKFGREVVQKGWDSKLDLRKEALNDLALFCLDVKPSKEMVDYLVEQAKDLDSIIYFVRIVELYKRHSRHQDVEILLKDVLNKVTDTEAVAFAHEELIWNYDRTKRHPNAVAQLTLFDTYCTANLPAPKKGEKESPRTDCQNKISEASKKLAGKWHATWKKSYGFSSDSGGEEIAKSADLGYRLYLKSVRKSDADLPAIRYAFAELLFARKNYREASEHYASVDGYLSTGLKIDEKIIHDAAYAAIVSLEKAVESKTGSTSDAKVQLSTDKTAKAGKVDGVYSDEDEKKFGELSEIYIKRNPKGTYVLDLRFKRAFIAYEKENYDQAAPQFKKIGWDQTYLVQGAVVPEKVAKAQDLYLDILNIKKDFKAIKESAHLLLAAASGARTGHVEKIYREAYFAEIQLKEESGDLAGAVESFKKFAIENAASELAPKAWWNASQIQFRMGDATGGANTCYQMHKLFKNSLNGKECLSKAAHTFEAIGRLDLAAKVLLNLAEADVESQLKWREVAADFFALSGSKDRAIHMYLKLAEEARKQKPQAASNSPSRYIPLLEKAAQMARENRDQKSLAQIETEYTENGIEPQASRLVVEQAEMQFERGDLTKAFNTAKKIIGKESLPKQLLARARMIQARVLEDEYRKASVKARMDRVGIVLAIKTEKLEKAQKAFQSTIRYGDSTVSVQALKRLGDCYIDYSKTVRSMTVAASLAPAEQASFKNEIEQLAIPMEEKGIESMNQALEMAKKSQLRDGQIAQLQSEVNKLNLKPAGVTVTVVGPQPYLPQFQVSREALK